MCEEKFALQYILLLLVSLLFSYSPNKKKPRIQGGHVTYRTRNIRGHNRNLNLGKKPVHIRFDAEGNPLKVKPSKTLNKVRNFLGRLEVQNHPESERLGVVNVSEDREISILSDNETCDNENVPEVVNLDGGDLIVSKLVGAIETEAAGSAETLNKNNSNLIRNEQAESVFQSDINKQNDNGNIKEENTQKDMEINTKSLDSLNHSKEGRENQSSNQPDQEKRERRARFLNSKLAIGDLSRYFTCSETDNVKQAGTIETESEKTENLSEKIPISRTANIIVLSENEQQNENKDVCDISTEKVSTCQELNNTQSTETIPGMKETVASPSEPVHQIQKTSETSVSSFDSEDKEKHICGNQSKTNEKTRNSECKNSQEYKQMRRKRCIMSKLAVGDLSRYFTSDNAGNTGNETIIENVPLESSHNGSEVTELSTVGIDDQVSNSETKVKDKNCVVETTEPLDNRPVIEKDMNLESAGQQPTSVGDFYNLDEELEIGESFDNIFNDDAQLEGNADEGECNRSKKRRKRRKLNPMPAEIAGDPELRKYWGQRYRLFSKFDDGIKMDRGKSYTRNDNMGMGRKMHFQTCIGALERYFYVEKSILQSL